MAGKKELVLSSLEDTEVEEAVSLSEVEVEVILSGMPSSEAVIEGRSFRGVEDDDWSLDGVATELESESVTDADMLLLELPPSASRIKVSKSYVKNVVQEVMRTPV